MPFGSAGRGEFGTYFVGYAASPGVTERMLANMFIGDPPGNYDRILDFSAAVTGGLFFVPSADFLRQPPGPPSLPARATAVPAPPVQVSPVPAPPVPATTVQAPPVPAPPVPATTVQAPPVPAPAVPAPAVPAPAVREPDPVDGTAPPGIPHQPGTTERADGLTRSGPAVTIPPRV